MLPVLLAVFPGLFGWAHPWFPLRNPCDWGRAASCLCRICRHSLAEELTPASFMVNECRKEKLISNFSWVSYSQLSRKIWHTLSISVGNAAASFAQLNAHFWLARLALPTTKCHRKSRSPLLSNFCKLQPWTQKMKVTKWQNRALDEIGNHVNHVRRNSKLSTDGRGEDPASHHKHSSEI